jgi:hypothetical protein
MNRRMPNGTSCGVGGRRERSRLLPDRGERGLNDLLKLSSRLSVVIFGVLKSGGI